MYSIPAVRTIHKHDQRGKHDMERYDACAVFVWGYTTHISVDMRRHDAADDSSDEEQAEDDSYDADGRYKSRRRVR